MKQNLEMDNELARLLDVLLDQPNRDQENAAHGRRAFLQQAQELAKSLPAAVTEREQPRHTNWMHPLQTIFRTYRKERSPMFGALGTILMIVSLILGGSGATVAAAQNSLPDQVLYPVKTWSEDVRTGLTNRTQTRLELALEYANRRAEEMQTMLRAGQVPADSVLTRMQAEVDLALQMAVGQPDHKAVQSLADIRQLLQAHQQAFANLGPKAGGPAEALLQRTRTMLQDRLQLCDQGMQDPALLRRQLRERDRLHDGQITPRVPALTGTDVGNPWTTGTPTPGSGYGPGPGDGNGGNNPWTTGTPTPGSGYGPGPGNGDGGNNPWTTGTPTPGSGYGPGPGNGDGGNNPWTTGTPTPGSGYGPGPGPTSGSGQPQNGNGSGTGSGSGSGGCTNCGGGDGSGSGSGGGSGTGSGGGAGSGSGSGGGRH